MPFFPMALLKRRSDIVMENEVMTTKGVGKVIKPVVKMTTKERETSKWKDREEGRVRRG